MMEVVRPVEVFCFVVVVVEVVVGVVTPPFARRCAGAGGAEKVVDCVQLCGVAAVAIWTWVDREVSRLRPWLCLSVPFQS